MNVIKSYRQVLGILVTLSVLAIVAIKIDTILKGLEALWEAVLPLLLGAFFAYILNSIVKGYEEIYYPFAKKGWLLKTRGAVTIFLALLSVVLVVVFVGVMAIPQLVQSIGIIVKALPGLYDQGMALVNQLLANATITQSEIQEVLNRLKELGESVGTYAVNMAKSTVSTVTNFVLGVIFALYMIVDKERLSRQWKRICRAYLPERRVHQISYVSSVANETFSKFFIGQFLDAIILGFLITLGLWISGVHYAVTIGCVVGLTAVIPVLGGYIGATMGIIMLLPIAPMEALIFLGVFVIVQQIEGNLIYPRLVGGSIGLPGLWVFAAITVGGSLYGITGMLLGVPLAATAYKLIKTDILERLAED